MILETNLGLYGMMTLRYLLLILLILLNPAWATPTQTTANQPINVVYYHQPTPNALDKISVAVWSAAAKILNINYVFIPTTDLNKGMLLLKQKQAEILIGALTPSQQDPTIDYINNYIPSNLGIVVNGYTKLNPIEKIWYLLKAFIGVSFAALMLYMLIFSILIWFVERKGHSLTFPRNPIKGIACAFWFTVTTFTTLGYGDFVPKTKLGRGVTIIWIFISLILASTFIATMSSEVTNLELQANRLSSSSQLRGQMIAYLKGDNIAFNSIHELNGVALAYPDSRALLEAVKTKRAQAALANNILLHQILRTHPDAQIQLADFTLANGSFAFAVLSSNKDQRELPSVLYTLETTGQINKIINNIER